MPRKSIKDIQINTEAAMEAVETAATEISNMAEEAKGIILENATKAVKAAEKKAPKATETAKKAASKAKKTVKDMTPVQETYFEVYGQQIMAEEIVAKIKAAYKEEGHRVSSIRSLKTYVNVDERKAYYIINEKEEGKFVEF